MPYLFPVLLGVIHALTLEAQGTKRPVARAYLVNCAIGYSAPEVKMYLAQFTQQIVAGVLAADLNNGIQMSKAALAAGTLDIVINDKNTITLVERARIVFTEIRADQMGACVVVEGDLFKANGQSR
jgi:hypothetical protein